MASPRNDYKTPNTWEILGAFFGYFAVANDAPRILRTAGISKLLPQELKSYLLGHNQSVDFWLLAFFTTLTFIFLLFLLWRKRPATEPQQQDDTAQLVKLMKRYRLINILRSFGLVLVRSALMDLFGVGIYGTFRRPKTWEKDPTKFRYIDRITFVDGNGIEYQYAKDFSALFIREHPPSTDTYGPSSSRSPTLGDFKILIFGSNIFPFWYAIHIVTTPIRRLWAAENK